MASSENVVSGGIFPIKRSNFSRTCSLLSKYLKENGSFGEVGAGLTQNVSQINVEAKAAPTGTRNLLPMIEKSGQNTETPTKMATNLFPEQAQEQTHFRLTKSDRETAQMTICYGGQVIVLDDFPEDKVKEIMMLATVQSPSETATPDVSPPLSSDLPIARKNSITRFLEKRKDRAMEKVPYQARALPKDSLWLGLSPQIPS